MVSIRLWKIHLWSHSLQGIYQLWNVSIRDPYSHPWRNPSPRGSLSSEIQCTYKKFSPYYTIHPPWSHICCQPSLNSCLYYTRSILPRNQSPYPLPVYLPALPHNISLWPLWHYHPWPPSRGVPMQLILPKDIQRPCCFCRWRIRPFPQWETCHSLHHPLFLGVISVHW